MLDISKVILGYNKNSMFCNMDANMQITETQTKPLQITLEDIHTQLKEIKFDAFYQCAGGMNNKDWELENARLIPFSLLYYYLFITQEKVPTPQLMVCEYAYRFCTQEKEKGTFYTLKEEYKEHGYSTCFFTIEALAARICRAYNSFNREVELGFRLLQEKTFSTRYSFQDDYYKGIDLGIKYNNHFLGVACYQNNKRTNDYKVLKETTRRSNYDKENIFSMAIDRNNHDTYGEFWAYSENEFQRLKAKIREKGEISNEF